MVIGIFSYAEDLTGGNYRLVRTLQYFPSKKFVLMMPKDRLGNFKSATSNLKDQSLLKILNNAVALPSIKNYLKNINGIIKYAKILSAEAKNYGIDFIYFPYGNQFFSLAFRLSKFRWTQLLQQSPIVGSLIFEEGTGYGLFRKNLQYNFNYNEFKIVKSYLRLLLLKFSTFNLPVLSVSESIKYEMEKLGINLNLYTVRPGNGVDPCFNGSDKETDLVFYARLIPQKGVYDFLKVVKKIPYANAVVAGFASEATKKEIGEYLIRNDLDKRVKLLTNISREDSAEILKRSKVFVYPSRLDSFALVVLESLSCGTPVVSYSIPAIRMNYLTEAVVKVKPLDVDSLIRESENILKNEKWVELGKAGKEYASKYSWEKVAASEWRILEKIYFYE